MIDLHAHPVVKINIRSNGVVHKTNLLDYDVVWGEINNPPPTVLAVENEICTCGERPEHRNIEHDDRHINWDFNPRCPLCFGSGEVHAYYEPTPSEDNTPRIWDYWAPHSEPHCVWTKYAEIHRDGEWVYDPDDATWEYRKWPPEPRYEPGQRCVCKPVAQKRLTVDDSDMARELGRDFWLDIYNRDCPWCDGTGTIQANGDGITIP